MFTKQNASGSGKKEQEQVIKGELYVDNLTADKFNKIVSSAFATKIEQDKEIDSILVWF